MEHVQGVELHKRINDIRLEATHFVDQLIDVECKFARYRVSQAYAVGEEGGGSDRFRIGPCVDWDIWRGGRKVIWVLVMTLVCPAFMFDTHSSPNFLSRAGCVVLHQGNHRH